MPKVMKPFRHVFFHRFLPHTQLSGLPFHVPELRRHDAYSLCVQVRVIYRGNRDKQMEQFKMHPPGIASTFLPSAAAQCMYPNPFQGTLKHSKEFSASLRNVHKIWVAKRCCALCALAHAMAWYQVPFPGLVYTVSTHLTSSTTVCLCLWPCLCLCVYVCKSDGLQRAPTAGTSQHRVPLSVTVPSG